MRAQCASPLPPRSALLPATDRVFSEPPPKREDGFQKTCDQPALDLIGQTLVDLATFEVFGFAVQPVWAPRMARTMRRTDFLFRTSEAAPLALLEDWVLRHACRMAAEWPDRLALSLPLSRRVYDSPDVLRVLVEALNANDFEATRLELRFNERYAAKSPNATRDLLFRLRDLGVRIALELDHRSPLRLALHDLPCDVIGVDVGAHDTLIPEVTALNALGVTLRATGVTSGDQLLRLVHAGFTQAQGPLFGAPTPAAQPLETTGTIPATLLRSLKDSQPGG